MYVDALNLNIENIDKYTREEIKNIYKKIALECHPDKLINITDEDERAVKIERFKKASIGYKKAIEDFDNYGKLNYCGTDYNFDNMADDYEIYNSFDLNFWKNTYDGIFKDKEIEQIKREKIEKEFTTLIEEISSMRKEVIILYKKNNINFSTII